MAPRSAGDIEVQFANTEELRQIAYRIRHDSYTSQGFLDPIEGGSFSDHWDDLPNSRTSIVFKNGTPAGSVRSSLLDLSRPDSGYDRIIAMESFESEIMKTTSSMGSSGRPATAMELSRLTRHPDFETSGQDVMFGIFRSQFYLTKAWNADMIVATVRHHHMPFYRRLGFVKIAEPKPYPRLKFELGLMICFRDSYPGVEASLPFFESVDPADHVCRRYLDGHRVRIFDTRPPPAVAPPPSLPAAPDETGDVPDTRAYPCAR
jgi:hypothetical protein